MAEKHAKRVQIQIPQQCYRKAIDNLLKTVYVIRKLFLENEPIMEVSFASRKVQKSCSSEKEMKREWGTSLAKKLQQRLMELKAAETLEDISCLPPARCHELTGDRKGQLSVDVAHPYRLILVPDHVPSPRKPDGGLDRAKVTKVLVLEVDDTHG